MVAEGTPEDITQVDASFTGQFLRHILPVMAYNSEQMEESR
jgi:excinuclease UvrABC ATPase subunit